MRLDDMIPNIPELKSDDIYPSFGPKKKQSKTDKIWNFASFDRFFAKNGVKCYPISILRPDLESSHHGGSFRPRNEERIKTLFLIPIVIF